MQKEQIKIYVAGHNGMVGSAIVRDLKKQGFNNIITRTHVELDLINQQQVQNFFQSEKPDQVYLAAAKVGGIYANNTFPADFIYQNLMIESNIINAAFVNGAKKLLFLGSSCIYPRLATQPMAEDALLTNTLESTNEPYAIAKIAGIKLCESYNRQYSNSHGIDYRSVMPTNLYGPGEKYHTENSHVIPAMIRRFHEAKINNIPTVSIWGTGAPRREFLYVEDMSKACIHVMNLDKVLYKKHTMPMLSHINVGVGHDITINELAVSIKNVIGYKGDIVFDTKKPDGSPQKLMDNTRIEMLGWKAKTLFNDGLKISYQDFLNNQQNKYDG
jgi:GDP-L-fucose synthase